MKVVAVIPCFNEGKTIGDIVHRCRKYVDEVVVVADNCTDNTISEAVNNGGRVLSRKGNKGPGMSNILGYKHAIKLNADIIVVLDGDGQHNPDDIPNLLRQFPAYDAVITSRFMDGFSAAKMPTYRKMGIWIITLAFNFGAKVKFHDSQCGFRAFKASVFKNINLTEKGFGYSTEFLVKLRREGFKIKEIPTNVIYWDDYNQNSSWNPVKHGVIVLIDTIKWRIKCALR
jgi:glycosyltransferase involved in cell wall biosynthesis